MVDRHHLKETVERYKKLGVETVGFGIATASVRNYYDKPIVLTNLDKLAETVVKELSGILLS